MHSQISEESVKVSHMGRIACIGGKPVKTHPWTDKWRHDICTAVLPSLVPSADSFLSHPHWASALPSHSWARNDASLRFFLSITFTWFFKKQPKSYTHEAFQEFPFGRAFPYILNSKNVLKDFLNTCHVSERHCPSCQGVCSFLRAAITLSQTRWLQTTNIFPHNSGTQKSKVSSLDFIS